MRLWSRILILVLAAAGFLAMREYQLLTTDPQQLTDLAIRQLQPDDDAAQTLRVADGSKNWLLSGWAAFAWIGAAAVCLFACDLSRLPRKSNRLKAESQHRKGESL